MLIWLVITNIGVIVLKSDIACNMIDSDIHLKSDTK